MDKKNEQICECLLNLKEILHKSVESSENICHEKIRWGKSKQLCYTS